MGLETIAAVGAIASAVGTIGGGIMQARQASQQAAVQRQQAEFARKQSEIDAREFRRRQMRLLGSARAARGASGVDLLSGSPLLVDDDTIEEIVFNTERIRRGGEVQATRLEQQASLTSASGSSALAGSVLSAGGSFLTSDFGSGLFSSGGANVASASRMDMMQPNALGGRR